jgi:hypothetical protein
LRTGVVSAFSTGQPRRTTRELTMPRIQLPDGDLSEHFSWGEAACRCGRRDCPLLPPGGEAVIRRAANFMERIRSVLGNRPIHVHSWFRCPYWNAKVGGVPGSVHLTGKAVDINVRDLSPARVQAVLRPYWPEKPWPGYEDTDIEHLARLRGLGIYPGFSHVDCGGSRPRKWTQRTVRRAGG